MIALAIKFWPEVSNWQLGDNDNLLRLHQIQTFIELPSWYVRPLDDFNPQDGNIVHWSRIPDIPVLIVYYFCDIVFDEQLSLSIAITVIPLLYFSLIMKVNYDLTINLFGRESALLSAFYSATSIAIISCMPGRIDHHNIQLLLFSTFLLSLFGQLNNRRGFLCLIAPSVALSLLIGLEVLPFFVVTLGVFCLHFLKSDSDKLAWLRDACFLIFALGSFGLWLTKPNELFLHDQYDVVSVNLLFFFLGAGVVLLISNLYRTYLTLLLCSVVVFGSLLIYNTEVISSPYSNYPESLKTFWLNNVVEAQSLIDIFFLKKSELADVFFVRSASIVVTIVVGILSLTFLKSQKQRMLWFLFILSLVPAVFWQVRTFAFSALLAVPLQAYIGVLAFQSIKAPIIRLVPVILISPMLFAIASQGVKGTDKSTNRHVTGSNPGYTFIRELQLEPSKLFAPMEQGAEILTFTNHAIIAAPYHRNIRGNLLYFNVLLSSDLDKSHYLLVKEEVGYVYFDLHDKQLPYLKSAASKESLVTRLIEDSPPDWLDLVAAKGENLRLYEVRNLDEL